MKNHRVANMDDLLKRLTEKKTQLDKLRPLQKDLEQSLDDWLRVEFTYSSNAIEGNTLSRIETAEVIERGVTVVISGKPLKDLLEARNHAAAIEFVEALAKSIKSHQYITEIYIKDIHKTILDGIDNAWVGKYRQTEVFVRGSNTDFPPPHVVPYAMQEFIQWLQTIQGKHPVIIAADAHFKFASIHPFVDGNGRTARLLMNLILLIHGYPMAVIRNEERIEYLSSFETARNKNNMQPFYNIVETSVERSLDAWISAAQGKSVMPQLTSKPLKNGKLLRIGELAKETGETLHTIRHWTQKGLLEVAEHTGAGYQLFDRPMIERVKVIRRLQKEERLSIDEIRNKLKNK